MLNPPPNKNLSARTTCSVNKLGLDYCRIKVLKKRIPMPCCRFHYFPNADYKISILIKKLFRDNQSYGGRPLIKGSHDKLMRSSLNDWLKKGYEILPVPRIFLIARTSTSASPSEAAVDTSNYSAEGNFQVGRAQL